MIAFFNNKSLGLDRVDGWTDAPCRQGQRREDAGMETIDMSKRNAAPAGGEGDETPLSERIENIEEGIADIWSVFERFFRNPDGGWGPPHRASFQENLGIQRSRKLPLTAGQIFAWLDQHESRLDTLGRDNDRARAVSADSDEVKALRARVAQLEDRLRRLEADKAA